MISAEKKSHTGPIAFLKNIYTISKLTKLMSCFVFGQEFSEKNEKNKVEEVSFLSTIIVPILLFFCIVFAVVYAYCNNLLSNHIGNFFAAILDQDRSLFYHYFFRFFGFAVLGAVANSCLLFIGELLFEKILRLHLTNVITNHYYLTLFEKNKHNGQLENGSPKMKKLNDHIHFLLLHFDRSVTDPSVRINVDISNFCNKLRLIIFGTPMYNGYLCSIAVAAYYLYTLYHSYGWFLPTGAVVIFVASILVSLIFFTFSSKFDSDVDQCDSNINQLHHFVAKNSESIALLHGEDREKKYLEKAMESFKKSFIYLTLISFPLYFFTMLLGWSNSFVTLAFPGLGWIFFGQTQLTDVTMLTNSTTVVWYTMVSLSNFLLLAREFSELAGLAKRLAELLNTLNRIGTTMNIVNEIEENGKSFLEMPTKYKEGSLFSSLKVNEVSIVQPSILYQNKEKNSQIDEMEIISKPLINKISFSLDQTCHSVLIMGPSGIGKSTLLRVIAGLWPAQGGYIEYPPIATHSDVENKNEFEAGCMMFLPQQPYFTPGGSLAEQISFPFALSEGEDYTKKEEIKRILRLLNLHTLLERYDIFAPSSVYADISKTGVNKIQYKDKIIPTPHDWSDVLSYGEQQRIGIARVLFHKPFIAVMDEATSALDEDIEYTALNAISQIRIHNPLTNSSERIHLLSVSHRSTVKNFHDHILKISEDGSWKLERNTEYNL